MPIIITGTLFIIFLCVTLWVAIDPTVCIDASDWFIDVNDPDTPADDHYFGFKIGDCR